MDFLIKLIETQGAWAAIAIFLVYWSRRDYQGVVKRLNNTDDFIRKKLLTVVADSRQTQQQTNDVVKQNTAALSQSAELSRQHLVLMEKWRKA